MRWDLPCESSRKRTTGETKVQAYLVAVAGYERINGSNASRILTAPSRATCRVMGQKSAEAIVAKGPG
jgi:hypothetical protein